MRMGGHGPPGMGLPRVTEEAGLLRRPAKEEACLPAALPRLCRGLCTSAPPLHLLCRLLSRLDDSQPLYLGDFGSTEEARRLSVPRSALARTPTLI